MIPFMSCVKLPPVLTVEKGTMWWQSVLTKQRKIITNTWEKNGVYGTFWCSLSLVAPMRLTVTLVLQDVNLSCYLLKLINSNYHCCDIEGWHWTFGKLTARHCSRGGNNEKHGFDIITCLLHVCVWMYHHPAEVTPEMDLDLSCPDFTLDLVYHNGLSDAFAGWDLFLSKVFVKLLFFSHLLICRSQMKG